MDKTINDYDIPNMATIVLWDNETLQEIYQKSGELAQHCEYQVHYWALNLKKVFSDGSLLYIQIPTVLFNYPQEVAGASVDFDLKDVEEVSNQLEPIQQLEIEKLYDTFKAKFPDFEFESVSLNTLHRHP